MITSEIPWSVSEHLKIFCLSSVSVFWLLNQETTGLESFSWIVIMVY